MTDCPRESSALGSRRGKRERLIAAAMELLCRQGVERTTLAQIASAANVPAGNVYYYFKTKDDLIAAAVAAHVAITENFLATITACYPSPRQRLMAFLSSLARQDEPIAPYGCTHGSLSSELDECSGNSRFGANLMSVPIDWAEIQFREIGLPEPRELAVSLLSRYHGSSLIANALRNPEVFTREICRLQQWVDGL